jgi:hypothetical protein
MKKKIAVLFAVGFLVIAANSQNATHVRTKDEKEWLVNQEKKATKILKELGATDDQIKKLVTVGEPLHDKLVDIRKDSTLSKEVKKKKLKETNEALNIKIKEILGEEKGKEFIDKFFPKKGEKMKFEANK